VTPTKETEMTTTNTSRPASGTDRAMFDLELQVTAGRLEVGLADPKPELTDAGDQRECATCDQPLVPVGPASYVHASNDPQVEHPARPRLAHPMDADPFALTGADDCDGSKTCPATEHVHGCYAEPAFPPAEPEPSMSLAQFQARVAAGEWNGKPLRGRIVHNGRITYRTKANRRLRNRLARRSRKINRGR
jgi:hypothetical protein